ncbi:hypothetical protein TWF679_007877 [Orbilia oligospora]|uniref:Uncharacterized protein n=1 Tax=Orbilia oligospora TaxID=2813651 RepID=A0A8H8V6F3_ORBOL|nr:hypothetical protein TWF679_007877 [Orbilia oligospora]
MSSNSLSVSGSNVIVLDGEENDAPGCNCCVGDVTPGCFVSHFQPTAECTGQGDTCTGLYGCLAYIHRRGPCGHGRFAPRDDDYDELPAPYKNYHKDGDINDIDVLATLETQTEHTFQAEKRLVQHTTHISGILNQFALKFESSYNRLRRPKSTDLSAPRRLRTKYDLMALENAHALASNSSQLRSRSRNPFRQNSYYSSSGSRSSSRSRSSHSSIDLGDDVNSIGTNASDDEPPLLCVPQCIAAGIPFYSQIVKGIATSQISELQGECDRYLRNFEGDFTGSWVIQLGEFDSRFRCPFAVHELETSNISLCLIVNAKSLDGIKNHIKTYHPRVSTAVLSCTSWHQIYDTCVSKAKAKPNSLPSPYFDLQLVREKYKQFWFSDLDLIQTNRTHGEDECFSEFEPLKADLDGEPDSLLEPITTDCRKVDSQDFLEIFSSFQVILHIWLSLYLEGGYESPFSAGSQGPWRVTDPGSGWNHHSHCASGNGVSSLQPQYKGQQVSRRDVPEDSDDEYKKGLEGRGGGGKTQDRGYDKENWRLGCPLQRIGLHELPCSSANGPGRRYSGAKKLSYLRSHIRTKHHNVWAKEKLDLIAHPHTTTWKQIFLTLFRDWPDTLPIPTKYTSAETLYEKLEGSPGFEITKEQLYLVVQRDTLNCWTRTEQDESYMDTGLSVQNLNNGHGVGLESNNPNISFDSGPMGSMVHNIRNPTPEIVSGPQGDHPGPDLQVNSFQNHRVEPDQVDTRGQYATHRPQTYASHSIQRNLEPASGRVFPGYQPNYLAPARAHPPQQMPLQISHTNQPLEYTESLYVSGHPSNLDPRYGVGFRFQNNFTPRRRSQRYNEFLSDIFDPSQPPLSPYEIQELMASAHFTPPNFQYPRPSRRDGQH